MRSIFALTVLLNLILLGHLFLKENNERNRNSPDSYYSMYQWLSHPIKDVNTSKEIKVVGFFGPDKRLYVNEMDYEISNKPASILVEYNEAMSGCVKEYVRVSGIIEYSSEQNDLWLTKISLFSKLPKKSELPVPKNRADTLAQINAEFRKNNCDLDFQSLF